MVLTSQWWLFLENWVYALPEPPPRQRTEPLQVICPGPPRSATESLQAALIQLGFNHTHHGWDILFEKPLCASGWARLFRRKYFNQYPEQGPITAKDFDVLLGNSTAVTDTAASVFAAEMIRAYPDAKVILNTRHDMDAWMASMNESILRAKESWPLYFLHWFDAKAFWGYHIFERLLWPGLFQCLDCREGFVAGTRNRGKRVYQEHCNMVRDLVPPERLLEWSAQDGWEPLCKFLGKEVPDTPFPHVNTKSKGWKEKEAKWNMELIAPAARNVVIIFSALLGVGGYLVYWRRA